MRERKNISLTMLCVTLVLFVFNFGCSVVLVPEPPVLDAGEVWVMDTKFMGNVRWKNVSPNPVQASLPPDISKPGFYVVTGPGIFNVAPGQIGLNTLISFKPPRTGPFTNSASPLIIQNNWQNRVKPVVLKGVGIVKKEKGVLSLGGGYLVPNPLRTEPLDFGNVVIGTFSTRTIKIENNGNKPINARILLAYGNPFWLVAMTSMGTPIQNVKLPDQGAITVIVTFKPVKVEDYWQRLEVFDIANRNNFAGIVMHGRGIAPLEEAQH